MDNNAVKNDGEQSLVNGEYLKLRDRLEKGNRSFLTMVILTFVNMLLIFFGVPLSFPFSAYIPTLLSGIATWFLKDGRTGVFMVLVGLAIVLTSVYLLLYFLSKKRMIPLFIALAFFILDTIAMLLLNMSNMSIIIIDIAFHVWVIYTLLNSIKYRIRWKKAYLNRVEEVEEVKQQTTEDKSYFEDDLIDSATDDSSFESSNETFDNTLFESQNQKRKPVYPLWFIAIFVLLCIYITNITNKPVTTTYPPIPTAELTGVYAFLNKDGYEVINADLAFYEELWKEVVAVRQAGRRASRTKEENDALEAICVQKIKQRIVYKLENQVEYVKTPECLLLGITREEYNGFLSASKRLLTDDNRMPAPGSFDITPYPGADQDILDMLKAYSTLDDVGVSGFQKLYGYAESLSNP